MVPPREKRYLCLFLRTMKQMGARVKLKPKKGYLKDTNGTSSRTALQNVKALWETDSISFMRLRNKSKGVSSVWELDPISRFQVQRSNWSVTKDYEVSGNQPRCCKRFCLALMKAKMSASARLSPVSFTDPEPEVISPAELEKEKKWYVSSILTPDKWKA